MALLPAKIALLLLLLYQEPQVVTGVYEEGGTNDLTMCAADLNQIKESLAELKTLWKQHVESDHSCSSNSESNTAQTSTDRTRQHTVPSYLYLGTKFYQLPTFAEFPCQFHGGRPNLQGAAAAVVSYQGTDSLMVCGGEFMAICAAWTENGWNTIDSEFYRYSLASSLLPDGRWLVSSGKYNHFYEGSEYYTSSARIYADRVGWTDYHDLPVARSRGCQVTVGESVYNIGGKTSSGPPGPSSTVYVSSHSQAWADLDFDLSTPRYRHACAVLNGRIYVIGGSAKKHKQLSSVEIFDPAKPSNWSYGPELPIPVRYAQAVVYEDILYVLANIIGYGPDGVDMTRVFSLGQGHKEWRLVTNITHQRKKGPFHEHDIRKVFPAPLVDSSILHCKN